MQYWWLIINVVLVFERTQLSCKSCVWNATVTFVRLSATFTWEDAAFVFKSTTRVRNIKTQPSLEKHDSRLSFVFKTWLLHLKYQTRPSLKKMWFLLESRIWNHNLGATCVSSSDWAPRFMPWILTIQWSIKRPLVFQESNHLTFFNFQTRVWVKLLAFSKFSKLQAFHLQFSSSHKIKAILMASKDKRPATIAASGAPSPAAPISGEELALPILLQWKIKGFTSL